MTAASSPMCDVTAAPDRPVRQDKVENDAFAGFLRRAIRAFGRRVGDGDVDGLRLMLDARDQLDEAIQAAVDELRSDRWSYSWAEIARGVGLTRTAACDRWGKRGRS